MVQQAGIDLIDAVALATQQTAEGHTAWTVTTDLMARGLDLFSATAIVERVRRRQAAPGLEAVSTSRSDETLAQPTVLTLRQVAAVGGYHYAYVRQLIASKRLPSTKRGKYRLVKVGDLLAYVGSTQPVRLPHVEAQLAALAAGPTAGAR